MEVPWNRAFPARKKKPEYLGSEKHSLIQLLEGMTGQGLRSTFRLRGILTFVWTDAISTGKVLSSRWISECKALLYFSDFVDFVRLVKMTISLSYTPEFCHGVPCTEKKSGGTMEPIGYIPIKWQTKKLKVMPVQILANPCLVSMFL